MNAPSLGLLVVTGALAMILALNFDCSELRWPAFQVIPYEATVAGVDRLTVFVELEREQVVGISSFGGAMVSGPHVVPGIEIWPSTCPARQ